MRSAATLFVVSICGGLLHVSNDYNDYELAKVDFPEIPIEPSLQFHLYFHLLLLPFRNESKSLLK